MHLGTRYLTRLFKLPLLGWYIYSDLDFIKSLLVITVNAARKVLWNWQLGQRLVTLVKETHLAGFAFLHCSFVMQ